MKLRNLTSALLAFVVLTLFSVGAKATVVNTLLRSTTPANTDILCRSAISSTFVQNCWTAADAPKNNGNGNGKSNGNGNPGTKNILSYFNGLKIGFDPDKLLYKAKYDGNKEEGPLAGSYSTIFGPASGDVENATIKYGGGPSVDCSSLANPCFVLIKGGQSPYSYLFNLALGWDRDPHYDDGSSIGGDGHGWSSNAIGTSSWSGQVELALRHFGDNHLGSISHVALFGKSVSEVPVPAAVWLFGTALLGFIGLSRKTSI